MKVTMLEFKNNKYNCCQTEKKEPLRASIGRPVWSVPLAKQKQKRKKPTKKDIIYDPNAVDCAATIRPAIAGVLYSIM